MTFRWLSSFAMLCALVALGVQPTEVAVPGAVERDAGCATALSARIGAGGPVHVLGCDPRGRGMGVLALGDPATARHVAVLVPGSDIDLGNLDDPARPGRRPLDWARALAAAAGRADPAPTGGADETAVVLWVGYRTPQGLGAEAASGRLARAGATALQRFVTGLRTTHSGPLEVTVIGHSYGAVVTALAAPGLAADDIVLLGSPGARARSVAELRTSARVWAARTTGDWARLIPHVRIGDIGHGTDPTSPAFGARPLPVDGTSGHNGYFAPGSAVLAGLAGVMRGRSPAPGTRAGISPAAAPAPAPDPPDTG
ncbi:alpha/beta hydrolase [Pseudonocardia sp. H11422]|uniref:alpha/beta hydrolase n=1 Tax=Pseudonocardia sp. H11422 TaxID=2835866 RepID=UPI0027E314BA|nr:alpha/beta hydrolase [Pseudonocardia sp. H11422]